MLDKKIILRNNLLVSDFFSKVIIGLNWDLLSRVNTRTRKGRTGFISLRRGGGGGEEFLKKIPAQKNSWKKYRARGTNEKIR